MKSYYKLQRVYFNSVNERELEKSTKGRSFTWNFKNCLVYSFMHHKLCGTLYPFEVNSLPQSVQSARLSNQSSELGPPPLTPPPPGPREETHSLAGGGGGGPNSDDGTNTLVL